MPACSYRRDEVDKRTNAKIREATARSLHLATELPPVVVHDTFRYNNTAPLRRQQQAPLPRLRQVRRQERGSCTIHVVGSDARGGGVGPRRACPWLMRERRGSTHAVGNAAGLAAPHRHCRICCVTIDDCCSLLYDAATKLALSALANIAPKPCAGSYECARCSASSPSGRLLHACINVIVAITTRFFLL